MSRRAVRVEDPGKLAVMVLAIIAASVLVAIGRISAGEWVGVVGVIVGYVTGNGRLARRGKKPQPMLRPKDDDQEDDDT